MVEGLQLLRTNPAHYGSSEITAQVKNVVQTNTTEKGVVNRNTFDSYLVDALNYVNDKQVAQTEISQQAIIDPNSVDVHDVTIAMAEANLSLSLTKSVIDRLTQAWSEITTTR